MDGYVPRVKVEVARMGQPCERNMPSLACRRPGQAHSTPACSWGPIFILVCSSVAKCTDTCLAPASISMRGLIPSTHPIPHRRQCTIRSLPLATIEWYTTPRDAEDADLPKFETAVLQQLLLA
jgi:hypothetical protein